MRTGSNMEKMELLPAGDKRIPSRKAHYHCLKSERELSAVCTRTGSNLKETVARSPWR